MKAVVIACLEPVYLEDSLTALARWMAPRHTVVINLGNTPQRSLAVSDISHRFAVQSFRPAGLPLDGTNTVSWVHQSVITLCKRWPDETFLKLDEDVILCSEPSRWSVGERQFLIPNLTINNLTTRWYLERHWPELAERTAGNPFMWHYPHPATGDDARPDLMRAIYSIDPAVLALSAQSEAGPPLRISGLRDYEKYGLVAELPHEGHRSRGVSCTAMGFRAQDYIELFPNVSDVDELLIGTAARDGRAEYVVDYSIFAHHINYWSVRELLTHNQQLVRDYNQRVISLSDADRPASWSAPAFRLDDAA